MGPVVIEDADGNRALESETRGLNGAEVSQAVASNIETPDFSEPEALQNLHIDEVEPPLDSDDPPPSPSASMPVVTDSASKSPKPSKASKTFRGHGSKVTPDSMRARAEEVNSDSKFVPKIENTVGDYFGLEIELSAWFEVCAQGFEFKDWVHGLEKEYHQSPTGISEVRSTLYKLLIHRSAITVSEAKTEMVDFVNKNMNEVLRIARNAHPSEDFDVHTLSFVVFAAHLASPSSSPLLDEGLNIVKTLLKQIAALRWFAELDDDEAILSRLLSRLFMLTRLALLATFGDAADLKRTQSSVWEAYQLEMPESEDDYASPINYAEFMEEVAKRYPACVAHPDDLAHNIGAKLRRPRPASTSTESLGSSSLPDDIDPIDPRDLVNGLGSVMPYVPESIVEACNLYKLRVKATPAQLQLHDAQTHSAYGTSEACDWASSNIAAVKCVSDLYGCTLGLQKSFVKVVVDFIMQTGKNGPSPEVHAALSSLWHLLQWFRAGHILMFEHLAALLFDCQFHLVAHVFCNGHPRLAAFALEPYAENTQVWTLLTSPLTEYDGEVMNWSTRDTAQLVIPRFNKFKLQTYTHLLGISRLMVTGKTQRLLVVAELSVDPFKPLFGLYESDLWLQLLLYLKAQVPFTGKRWRYLNMELISAIYLYCPSRIDDNWLSGSDVTQVVRNAPAEETTLRELVVRFNERFL